jgi:ABC-type uncharacterized transport system substrate-binding protein
VNRRDVLLVIGVTLASATWSSRSRAQQSPRLPLVGIIGSVPAEIDGFYRGMRELGYVEGQNVAYARGTLTKPGSVLDLVALKPAVVVTAGAITGVRAVQAADGAVPIVAVTLLDAVESGVVASLAHPGGYVTGLSHQNAELAAKRLEVLHDALPEIRRVALLYESPGDPDESGQVVRLLAAVQNAAQSFGMQLQVLELTGPESFDAAFAAAAAAHAEAAINGGGRFITPNRAKFLALAAIHRLPMVCHQSVLSRSGCLMSYGPSFPDLFRRAAYYVDKILKGAKPADLPIEQPTKFELVINLKTARALGLAVPQSFLDRADEVIE